MHIPVPFALLSHVMVCTPAVAGLAIGISLELFL